MRAVAILREAGSSQVGTGRGADGWRFSRALVLEPQRPPRAKAVHAAEASSGSAGWWSGQSKRRLRSPKGAFAKAQWCG